MNPRTRAVVSFATVAIVAMLLGGLIASQIQHPDTVLARTPDPQVSGGHSSAFGPDTFREIARRESPGVVNVTTKKVVRQQAFPEIFDLFGENQPRRRGGARETETSLGSGFVIDKTGYILTNRHVVEGVDGIRVTLANGAEYDAKLIGKDARTDVALIKIEPREGLTVLPLGDSDEAEAGEWVIAIGNAFGLGNTVTVGVVSFKGRPQPLGVAGTTVNMVQTDAAINPGNSGGPLLNLQGEVIGINTMIVTRGAAQSAGVGFAVPINVAKQILPQLRDKGRVVRGWLGVKVGDVDENLAKTFGLKEAKGTAVQDVTAGSPAEKAGLQPEDLIVQVDNTQVDKTDDLVSYVTSKTPGTVVQVHVLRAGTAKTIPVTLAAFPEDEQEQDAEGDPASQLGMSLRDLTPRLAEQLDLPRSVRGVVVVSVEPGQAAEDARLQKGDVISTVDGQPVESVAEFEAQIGRAKTKGVARLWVRRGNDRLILVLQLRK